MPRGLACTRRRTRTKSRFTVTRLLLTMDQPIMPPVVPPAPLYPAVPSPAPARKAPGKGLQIGDYMIGDDAYSNLFGPPDIRY